MNILFAIKSMDHTHGGAERVCASVTGGLARMGHNVSLLSFDAPGGQSFYPLDQDVRRISLPIGNPSTKTTLRDIVPKMAAIRRTVLKEKPDVVVAFMHSTFVPAALALIGTGVPTIASEHIVPHHYKTRPAEYALLVLSSFFVRKITVISKAVRDLYPKILHRKMVTLPNPVQIVDITDTPPRTQPRRTILNVGRLDEQKDQKTLIKAFSLLAEDYPDWDLKIMGEGHLRPDLEALVDQYGLKGRVLLPGITQDIHAEYDAADIFALSSTYESFGLATVEAMAHGLPAVGFADCPGTNEVIDHNKNGLLADGQADPDTFSEALKTLIDNENLRQNLGQAARQKQDEFKPDTIHKKWEALIRSQRDLGVSDRLSPRKKLPVAR